jgi:alpha/beta superfamily hydrolase
MVLFTIGCLCGFLCGFAFGAVIGAMIVLRPPAKLVNMNESPCTRYQHD